MTHKEHGQSKAARSSSTEKQRSERSDQQEFHKLLSHKNDIGPEAELDEWGRFYSFARPHGAQDGQTPDATLKDKLQ